MINPEDKQIIISAYENYKKAKTQLDFAKAIIVQRYDLNENDTLNIFSDVSVNNNNDNIKEGVDELLSDVESSK